ncbi:MAG: protein O-mannosyl-transferase [Verrucomicrobiota bacterium]|jgi:tetratricopeptide (TPR) repeat protein
MSDKLSIEADQARPTGGSPLLRLQSSWVFCPLLAILGFIVRAPALQGQPVWDDDYLIRTNPFIKSPLLILEVFRHYLFQDTFSAHYRPVQNISYMADYLFWNSNFYGFHLSSVLYHVAGGILLYFLVRKLVPFLQSDVSSDRKTLAFHNPRVASVTAFFVALLWVVHPVHSAAIDYVSGRADSLCFLFGCAAWLAFLTAWECSSRWARWTLYSCAWFFGLLALCSRESGCLWIGLFLLYLFGFEQRMKRAPKWIAVIFCVALVASYMGLRHLPGPDSIPQTPSEITPPMRVVLMLRSLGDYGRLMLFPANLHMERTVYDPKAFQSKTGRWHAIEHEYLSIAGLFVLAVFLCLSFQRTPGQKFRIFGAAWFLIAYLPTSNLIELNATVAEHWLYLPSVGFLIFLAGCAFILPPRWQRVAVAFACVAALALGVRSGYRSSDWVSNETFAHRTIASGGATIRIILLLGQAYAERGDYASAERLLRRALELSPNHPTTRNNLADALVKQGRKEEAEALFVHATEAAHESRKDYPRTWIAALNLSQLRHTQHDDSGAIAILEKARKDYPGTWELIGAESELLRETNDLDGSLTLIRPFAQNNWWHYRAWGALGRLLAQKGDDAAATDALRHASRLDVHETAALNLIAMMRVQENRLDDAFHTQQRAVARQPDQPRQYLLLSNILDQMGRTAESRAALAQVSRLRTLADATPTAR